ncbi:hypothetical protein XH83_07385 [Bradyrhizobium sp. CCBAU 53351]|uniref:hypothetical protein n=1 Tax=Bradyrhizobium sp. CCBAU 53351 TaxID=1325114 RepID=UPI0018899BC6|nr:hypothetical protein [Bradyrhizobium sp. CCBAU 53351]QOZ75275.1 hypothetical protein XH83_07385 [Bradyrhizobium sp. CCBAU 53351]
MADWMPVFLIPNLRVAHEVISEEVAIVPCTDDRLKAYESIHPEFKKFVQKFTDPFGARVSPGVLLLRSDAPKTFRSIEAVSSFRDLLALSVIPLQRARGIVHDGSHYIQYSDYFDFYPWVYHEKHKHLVCHTPGQVALHEVCVFRGQTSPILSALDFDHMDTDNPLLTALIQRWRQRYSTKRPLWTDRALFRSLNMAAAASKMPAGADLTTFSLGRNIGLWVSAFEILTHTGQDKVRLWDVYDRLGAAPWRHKKMKARRFKPTSSKTKRNLGCWIYGEIYRVRNDFLHGNPVDEKSLIVKRSGRNLFSYASILYRMALTGFLDLKPPDPTTPSEWSRARFDFYSNQGDVEEALLSVLVSDAAFKAERAARLARVRMVSRRAIREG